MVVITTRARRGIIRGGAGAISALALALSAPALAQQPASAQQPANVAALGPGVALGDGMQSVTDVFMGRNTSGPYVLSWRSIQPGSDVVVRGGQKLNRDTDYKLDPKTGALTFTTPLRAQEIARVDYQYNPAMATANSAAQVQPIQLNLFERNNGAFVLNALYKPDTASPGTAATPASGLMLLSLGGNAHLTDQSTLTSKLFLDGRGGNLLQRGGVQVKESTKTSFGLFSAGITRGGSDFKGGDASGIAAGRQVIEASGALSPIHGIAASATFQQMSDLPTTGRGTVVTTLGQKLSGGVGTMKFAATRTDTTTGAPDGTATNKVTNRLQLDQKLGASTSATAVVEHTDTQAGADHAVAQTSSLTVRSQPISAVTVSGSFQNQLTPSGAQDATSLKVDAQPTKFVKLSALLGDRFGPSSATHNRQASLEYSPIPMLTLGSTVKMNADGDKDAMTTGITAAVRPTKFLEIDGGFHLRDASIKGAPDPSAVDGYEAKLTLGLPKNLLKLTTGYADNPDDERGNLLRARTGQVAVQSTLGQFDINAGYQLREDALTPTMNSTLDLKLGWRLAKTTQLIGAYRQVQTQNDSLLLADTYSFSLAHRLGSLLDLSLTGAMTTNTKDGVAQPNPDYRADVKLGLKF